MKIDQNLTFSLNFLANKIWQIHLRKHDINALMETGICQTLQETALQTNSSADFNYIPQKWFMVLKYSANNKIWECWPPRRPLTGLRWLYLIYQVYTYILTVFACPASALADSGSWFPGLSFPGSGRLSVSGPLLIPTHTFVSQH